MKKIFRYFYFLISVFFILSCQVDSPEEEIIKISSLTFNEESCTMEIGQQRAFAINYNPKNANVSQNDFVYKLIPSDLCNIVSQDNSGCIIESIKSGSCVLQCTCQGYTAYSQIEIDNPVLSQITYISLPYTDINMEIGSKRTIVANIVGGMKEDFSEFIWESSDDSIVSVESSSNTCVIQAKKKGICTITVSNPNVAYPSQMLVVVPQKENEIFYITTKDNIINMKEGDTSEFEIEIIGGEETDYSNVIYNIKNGEENISISGSGKKCSIRALKSGEANIEVIHKKSKVNLNIKVIVNKNNFEGGIDCSTDFVVLNDFNKKELEFNLNGIKGGEWSYNLSENDIIDVTNVNNKFIINAKNEGKVILSVYNSLIVKPFEVLIICENLFHDISYCQINTEQQIIRCEKGDNGIELKMTLLGGNETDYNGFEWIVSDSNIINVFTNNGKITYSRSANVPENCIEGKCYINAINEGKATITVKHPKSSNDFNVEVYVYPKGTFEKKELIIKGNNFVNCEINNNLKYNYKILSGEINESFRVKSNDESILNITYDKNGEIILKALREGYTYFTIDADNIKNTFRVDVFCGTKEQILENNYISVDFLKLEGMTGKDYYFEVYNSNNNNNLTCSSSNPSVCSVNCFENIIQLKYLNKGNVIITVKGDLSNNILSIPVEIYDEENVTDTSFIKGKQFYKLIKNEETKLDLTVVNNNGGNFEFDYDNNLISIYKKNNDYYVKGISSGYNYITVKHSNCASEFKISYNVYENKNEADSNIMLYCDYDLIQGEAGKDFIFTLKSSEGIVNNIIPQILNENICSVETRGDLIHVHLIYPGNTILRLNALNSFININVNCLSSNISLDNKDSFDFKIDSVISCIINETNEIKCSVNDKYKNQIKWEYPPEFTAYANKNIFRFIPTKSGTFEIECSLYSETKKCIVHVFNNKEEINNANYFISDSLLYNIKKGSISNIKVSLYKEVTDEIKSKIRWQLIEGNNIKLNYYQDKCEITAIEEGKAVIKIFVEDNDSILPITIQIVVNQSQKTQFDFSAPRIVEIDKNGGGFNFSLLQNNISYGNINDYKDVKIVNYNENLETSITGNYVRLYSSVNGNYKITLNKSGFNDYSILIVVKDDLTIKENIIFANTDSLILTNNQTREIEFYSGNFDIKDAVVSTNGKDCITYHKIENGKYSVSYKSDGECILKCSYKDVSYSIKINCISNNIIQDINISCEPFIIIKENEIYETNVFCNNTVSFECKNSNLKLEVNGNKCKLQSEESNLYELKVYLTEENYRIIYVYVYKDNLDNFNIFNISQRIYKLNINDELTIIPSVYNCNLYDIDYNFTENGFAEIDNNNGVLKINAKKSGYFEITAYKGNREIKLYFYVNNKINNINSNDSSDTLNYFIFSDNSYINMIPGLVSNFDVYLTDLSGNKYYDFESLIWKTDNKDIFEIETLNNNCTIKALKNGKGYIYVSSLQAKNVYVITVDINDGFNTTNPYLYTEKRNIYFDILEKEKTISISLNNCNENELNKITYSCSNNIFNFSQKIKDGKLLLTCSPLEYGSSKVIVSHPLCEEKLELFLTVKNENQSNIVYLTTQQNYVLMRPGQTKLVSVELVGDDIIDSSNIIWEQQNNNGIITLIGSGTDIQVYANKEGVSHLKARYSKNNSDIDIYIEVNDTTKDVKYITTSQNVIECDVSKTMDFFSVNLVGGNIEDDLNFECSVDKKDIVSVICDHNLIYYRGIKAGQALLTITNTKSNAVNTLQVRIIVEENNIEYGIKSDKNTLYMEKNGSSKSINIESYGDINIDNNLLDWFVYSGSDVIDITYSGARCVVKPKKDGFAKIRCTYPKLKLYCNIGVYVGQNIEFNFTETAITVEEEECKFINIKLPDNFDNPGDYIVYESLNPNICSVFGTGRVCCVEGLNKGNCIIRATNNFDGSVCEAGVTVTDKNINKYKLLISKNTYILNPRSSDQRLRASISGKGLNETENEDIEWEIVSDTSNSLSLYPNKGSDVLLQLNTITDPSSQYFGRVGCGEALIKVKHPRTGDDYKTIYVVINELDNFFTLDKYSANVNVSSTMDITCSILNAKISDYDNVTWSVTGYNTDKYGNKVEVARLLSKKGRICTLFGLNDGICTVTAYYYGNVVQCEVNVNADRVFRINGASSIKMFPDAQEDNFIDVSYILRPSQNVPIWSVQNLDKPSDITVLTVEEVNGEQKIRIRPNGVEGKCTISGLAVGIGQVTINVDVKFDPELRLNEEVNKVLIKMEDNGLNEKEFTFYSYPAMYYVGVVKSGPYADYVSVYVDESELIGDYLQGKVHVKVNKEFPVNGCIVTLQQYRSSSLASNTVVNSANSKLSFSVSGYYEDSGFYLGYTKGRGNFINYGKSYNVNNNFSYGTANNTYYKFFDTNMKQDEIPILNLADCEKQYFVLKNRHANSFMKDLKIQIVSDEYELEIKDNNLKNLCNSNEMFLDNIDSFSKQNFPKLSQIESKSDGSFVFDIDTGEEGSDYGIDWNIYENKNKNPKKSHNFYSNKITLENLYFGEHPFNEYIFDELHTERYDIKYFYHPEDYSVYVYSFKGNPNYYNYISMQYGNYNFLDSSYYTKKNNLENGNSIPYYTWTDKMGDAGYWTTTQNTSNSGTTTKRHYDWRPNYNLIPNLNKEQYNNAINLIKDHSLIYVYGDWFCEPVLYPITYGFGFAYYYGEFGDGFYNYTTYNSWGHCRECEFEYKVYYDFDVGEYLFICEYDDRKTWDDTEGHFYRIFYCNNVGPGDEYYGSYKYNDSFGSDQIMYLPGYLCSPRDYRFIYNDEKNRDHTLWNKCISMSHGGTDRCLDSTSCSLTVKKFSSKFTSEKDYLCSYNYEFNIEDLFSPGEHSINTISKYLLDNKYYSKDDFYNDNLKDYNLGRYMYSTGVTSYYSNDSTEIVNYNNNLEFNSKVFNNYNYIFKIIGSNKQRRLTYLNNVARKYHYANKLTPDYIYKKIYLYIEWIELKNYDTNKKTTVIIPIYLNFYNNYYDYTDDRKNRINNNMTNIIDIYSIE